MNVTLQRAFGLFPFHDFACPCCNMVLVSPHLIVGYYDLTRMVDAEDIKIHSGYRCYKHNLEIGGSPTSLHLRGEAIDLHIAGVSIRDQYDILNQISIFRNGGIGVYKQWNNPGLHGDTRKGRKRWEQIDGIYRRGIKWNG